MLLRAQPGPGLPVPSLRTFARQSERLRLGILPALASIARERVIGSPVPTRIPGGQAKACPMKTGGFGRPVPREPAYADERSQDGEAKSASERAEGMDARSERPATGHGSPEAGLGA